MEHTYLLTFGEQDNQLLEVSTDFVELVGIDEEDIQQFDWQARIDTDYQQRRADYLRQTFDNTRRIQPAVAYPFQINTDTLVWISETAICNQQGKPTYAVLTVLRDFTPAETYSQTCAKAEQCLALLNIKEQRLFEFTDASSILYDINQSHLKHLSVPELLNLSKDATSTMLKRIITGKMNRFFFDLVNPSQSLNYELGIVFFNIEGGTEHIWVNHIIKVDKIEDAEQNRLQFSQLFEDNPMLMSIIDIENRCMFAVNKAARKHYGVLPGMDVRELDLNVVISKRFDDVFDEILEVVRQRGFVYLPSFEQTNLDTGETFFIDVMVFFYNFRGRQMLCCANTDVTERVQIERQNEHLKLSLEHSPSLVLFTDSGKKICYANDTLLNKCGYSLEEIEGLSIKQILHLDTDKLKNRLSDVVRNGKSWQGDLLAKKRSGGKFWIRATFAPIKEDEIIRGVVLVAEDLTAQLENEDEKERLRLFDMMTKLGNRNFVFNELQKFFAQQEQPETMFAILDINNLSRMNDTLGLEVGDSIIQEVAKRLKKHTPDGELARLGGDEFAIIRQINSEETEEYLQNLLNSCSQPLVIDGHKLRISVSAGITRLPYDAQSAGEALSNAELALFHAKKNIGQSSYYQFNNELLEIANKRMQLEVQLHRAISEEQFELHYQPKIDLVNKNIVGYEALIRWYNPQIKKVMLPTEFIPFAEETGMILEISEWVLQEVCKQSLAWEKAGQCAKIAINISVHQFLDPDFIEKLAEVLKQTGVTPANIELEITESMLMQNMQEMLPLLHQIKALGVTLAIDDFGTGYSSLSYLKDMPVDVLKIDRSFIKNLPTNNKDCVIAHSIISLAQNLNMQVVAEGVETKPQAEFLQKQRCDFVQGFYFYRPMTVGEVELAKPPQPIRR